MSYNFDIFFSAILKLQNVKNNMPKEPRTKIFRSEPWKK